MYKDKDKQREANRRAQARFKAKGITSEGITDRVLPDGIRTDLSIGMVPNIHHCRKMTFKDLPLDVQQSIEYMSQARAEAGENSYENEKQARTERAIKYQQLYPDVVYRPDGVNLELCRVCQAELPALEQPRRYSGTCLSCSTDRGGVFKDGMIRSKHDHRPDTNKVEEGCRSRAVASTKDQHEAEQSYSRSV